MATNTYETVFIAEPEISNDQVDQLINRLKQTITSASGSMTGEDRWGRRRLAYAIRGHREGYYAVLSYTAEPTVVASLDHLFNVTDSVIRHLTTRVIKKNKKFAPRRERPAGAPEAHRGPGGRSGGPSRGRPAPSAPAPSAPAAETVAPTTPAPSATPAASEGSPTV